MAEVGTVARRGDSLAPATLQRVEEVARETPLAPEPFLIHGALAQAAGQQERAERLFTEARSRDPRSEAARFFLTDRYLRTGRTAEALAEMAVFARLVPDATAQFAPALAAFAHTPEGIPQLRKFFRSSPEFQPMVLAELAGDASNADLILALANSDRSTTAPPQPWQAKIVSTLIEQQQFGKAYSVWKTIAGVPDTGGLFNARFLDSPAPPPFNWAFATAGGVAEPAGDGRLQVIYYGRQDTVLAQQLLLLPPGRYQLTMDVTGQAGDGTSIAWSLKCLPQNKVISTLPLEQRTVIGNFSVPQGCPAQRLELNGSAGDFPQSINFTISKLKLIRVASR